jgi:hypothetical protein
VPNENDGHCLPRVAAFHCDGDLIGQASRHPLSLPPAVINCAAGEHRVQHMN